jgi:hypothetical protein
MKRAMRFICGLGLLVLVVETIASADTWVVFDCTCPLCDTKFKATLAGSATHVGQRLDLRPLGSAISPWPIPVCSKCGFVMFKGFSEKHTAEELATLRGLVNADGYKKLPANTPSYERLAVLYEGLKRPPFAISSAYLQASWQVEDQPERNRVLLEKSRKWIEKYLEKAPKTDEAWTKAEVLRGELLRRVGKFEESKAQLERLGKLKEFTADPFPHIIGQELTLIEAKDTSPQEIK